MKKLYFLVLTALMLSGCYFENKIQNQGALDSREAKPACFVEFKDGRKVAYSSLIVKRPPLQYEYLEGDGEKLKVDANDIIAFQTEKFYAFKIYDQAPGVIGKLPFTELFAVRVVNGKIELFAISEMKKNTYGPNESGYDKTYYLRKGKEGKLIEASKKNLKNLISDNKTLLDEFESLYKKTYPFKSIMKVLEQYN